MEKYLHINNIGLVSCLLYLTVEHVIKVENNSNLEFLWPASKSLVLA